MTPEEKKEFEDIKRTLASITQVRNISFVAELQRQLTQGFISVEDGASTTGTSIAVRNAADSGSETVADNYAGVLTLTDTQGNTYRIGYY
jgi:hypothetical protein